MAIDQAIGAWEAMELEANEITPATGRRQAGIGLAVAFTRTTVLLVLAALSILVLLPAVLAAQVALLG